MEPDKKTPKKQFRILSTLAPGVGAFDKEKLKPHAASEKHEHTKGADEHHEEHAHHEISPKELRKLVFTMALKAVLGITGMMIGVFIGNMPGMGLVGIILAPLLGILFFQLGGKTPEGHH